MVMTGCKGMGNYRDVASRLLLLGIRDLAVINDQGKPCCALTHGPTDLLAKFGVDIRHEELPTLSQHTSRQLGKGVYPRCRHA